MTIYACDRCGVVVNDQSDLIQMSISFYNWQKTDEYWKHVSSWKPKDRDAELCSKCRGELLNTLSSFMKQGGKKHGKTKSNTSHGD
jgi:hypothetical protein